jgi:photosystem II stability/assembly factor-like uncharacterized protein
MRKFIVIILILSLITAFSCTKETTFPSEYNLIEISFSEKTEIRDFASQNDSVFYVCGGSKNENGYVYRSSDTGKTWEIVMQSDSFAVNTLYVDEYSGFWAAGDSLNIWNSKDEGVVWASYDISNYPWDNYIIPYLGIYAWNEKEILAVGGEFYQKGISSKTKTGSWPWVQTSWDNEWYDLLVWNINYVLISGYGQVLFSDDRGETFHDSKLYGDAFVQLEINPYNEIFVLGQHGEIYQYNNQNWIKIENLTGKFSDIAFSNDNAFVGGQNGCFYVGDVHCEEWQKIEEFTSENITSIVSLNQAIFIGTQNGKMYSVTSVN